MEKQSVVFNKNNVLLESIWARTQTDTDVLWEFQNKGVTVSTVCTYVRHPVCLKELTSVDWTDHLCY